MKMAFYQSIAAILFFTSCQDAKNNSISLLSSHQQKKVLLKGADSSLQNMTTMLEAAFHYTQCNKTIDKPGASPSLQWEQAAQTDSIFNLFYSGLTALSAAHPCLRSGTCQLVDETNAHILAYTAKNDTEELLVILNFDEDNRALKADYRFMDMPMLLGNYYDGALPVLTTSLLLRPFEARIYQVQ
jgi:glycosidase